MFRRSTLAVLIALLTIAAHGPKPTRFEPVREAAWYRQLEGGIVRCELCPRQCLIEPGKRGVCRVRENKDGKLYSVVYGRPCTVGKEPIEKAPFFHFLPGRTRITLATAGCNQSCLYCQNWEMSQSAPEDLPAYDLPPEDIVAVAEREHAPIICLTYTEPVVFYEYMCDIARLARPKGIRTAVVTGGYINAGPLEDLCDLVDAIKIDLKGITDDFYRDVCGSSLEPVLDACRTVAASGTHLELVNLVVPHLNDDTADLRRLCRWVVDNLGDTVPVHFTRFGPAYRLRNSPPTPVSTLETAVATARSEGLDYVFLGNVPGHRLENTYCPGCDGLLIERTGFTVTANRIADGRCPSCNRRIPGIWQ